MHFSKMLQSFWHVSHYCTLCSIATPLYNQILTETPEAHPVVFAQRTNIGDIFIVTKPMYRAAAILVQ
ncbi:hypothetical protein XENTR_v10019277 [Xenopus tropicalis]|nr:hypothetical protein XENTR_v10019277 [Xenopus tropicalis]